MKQESSKSTTEPTPELLLQTPEVNAERQEAILELLGPLLSELTAELTPEKCSSIEDPAAFIESLLDSEEMMSRVKEILSRHNREVAERDEEDA